MNANELADALQGGSPYGLDDAARMLRQQADSILELDVNLKAQIRLAYDQADRIAELEKLVSQRFDDGKRLGIIETEDRLLKAKTLTDEEIWEVINRTAWVGTEEEIRFKIAEAILRKAQK
jgi:hypothetical protein